VGRGGGIVTNETRKEFIFFGSLYDARVMSGEGAIITVETRKKIHTIRADEVANLCDRRLDRKSSKLHVLRNGKEGQTYNGKPWESGGRKHRRRSRKADSYWRQFCEKSTIQCLDVKVVCSKYEDTK
jgi:hypothetical protein